MNIELSQQTREALRLWAQDVHDDNLLFDQNASAPEFWAWVSFQLWMTDDRPRWFPKGKSATIQAIESYLYREAYRSLPEHARNPKDGER